MMANKVLTHQIYKKWWFWLIVGFIVFSLFAGAGTNTDTVQTNSTAPSDSKVTEEQGKLPKLDDSEFKDKEALVAFKDLTTRGYFVTAKYTNEKLSAANKDLTEDFKQSDVNSCADRLGYDAYIVKDISQVGDSLTLNITNVANMNQECPAGTTNDLE